MLCAKAMLIFLALGLPLSATAATPKAGYVPDERTAVAIAEAILVPIYGNKLIETEKPFHAKLENGIWTVEGTLPQGADGGIAVVKLASRDARVISVVHGK